MFPGSEDSRYGLVKRALASGEIIRIRRGLYCLAPKYQKKGINLYALAQLVYGPSYVSLESALSWHGWIPEAVHAITGASFKKAKEFTTPLGVFRYDRVPQQVFYTEVERLTDASGNCVSDGYAFEGFGRLRLRSQEGLDGDEAGNQQPAR